MSIIHAHEAAISTATVEIKTLMVSNRQMTQAIFRQLESGWPWGEGWIDARLWGWVNHHFPGCCERPAVSRHVHVVFSASGGLHRGTVYELRHGDRYWEARNLPQLFIAG